MVVLCTMHRRQGLEQNWPRQPEDGPGQAVCSEFITTAKIRWILKILHDPRYHIPWFFSINSSKTSKSNNHSR